MSSEGAIQWAEAQFGAVCLGDARRTRRLVKVAAEMADLPAGSLPEQLQKWGDLKAAYRLFDSPQVTFHAVAQAHYERRHVCQPGRYLIISDTTELNFTWQRQIADLGPLGKGQGYGFLLHSALMLSKEGVVCGLAGQQLICRRAKKKRTRTQSLKESRESQLWTQVIDAVGSPPAGAQWVHVADRGADNFEVYHHCHRQCCDWIIRARCLTRKLLSAEPAESSDGEPASLQLQAILQALPVVGSITHTVRFRKKRARDPERPAHVATLEISIGRCQMPPPRLRSAELKQADVQPIAMQIVHVREVDPPSPKAAINWVLYTSLPVDTLAQAQEVIRSYEHRWKIEEWHKCLKTGTRVTDRQLQTRERLEPLIALLSIQAVRLLSLRDLSRNQPDTPAAEHVPSIYLQVLQEHRRRTGEAWSIRQFVHEVAGLGGFLKRNSDGDPGWQTIWRGWQKLTTLTEGYRLAKPP